MRKRTAVRNGLHAMAAVASLLVASNASADSLADLRQRLPQDEVIYFLLPDRFANGDATNDHGG